MVNHLGRKPGEGFAATALRGPTEFGQSVVFRFNELADRRDQCLAIGKVPVDGTARNLSDVSDFLGARMSIGTEHADGCLHDGSSRATLNWGIHIGDDTTWVRNETQLTIIGHYCVIVDMEASRFAILWSFARPFRHSLILALGLGLVASGMDLATPMVTKWILDTLSIGGSIAAPVATLAVLIVLGTSIGWFQWLMLGKISERIVYGARSRLIGRFLTARVLPMLQRPTGEMVTRVTSDSVLLREAASSSLIGLINGSIVLVGTLVLMGFLDVTLLLTTLTAVTVVAVIFLVLMPGVAKAHEQAQESLAELGSGVEGNLRALKTVKAARAEPRQYSTLMALASKVRHFGIIAVRREVAAWTIASAGIQVAILVVLALGAARVASGDMTVSTLVAFLMYAFNLMYPIMELSQNTTALQSGIAAAGRIREIDALPREGDSEILSESPSDVITGPFGLRFEDVTASYESAAEPALREVSFTLPARGHIALVGPSGAGKTTVMSTILRFLEPTDGKLWLSGRDSADLSPAQSRRGLAYVEQETPVVPGTIRDNLTFINPSASEERIHEVLGLLKLDGMIASLPDGLDTTLSDTSVSGGQRQRIAVARALLADPQLLLLDEATAQVDGLTETAIHQAINQQASRGTVLTIAHRLSTIVDADEILVMDQGKVAAHGSHNELLQRSQLYRDLVTAMSLEPIG